MENLYLYIIAGLFVAAGLIYVICMVGKITKMSKEERIVFLKTFLKGLIADAEAHYGAGHGQDKLAEVEAMFAKKAPFLYKLALKLCGAESLTALIESALQDIKDSFEK